MTKNRGGSTSQNGTVPLERVVHIFFFPPFSFVEMHLSDAGQHSKSVEPWRESPRHANGQCVVDTTRNQKKEEEEKKKAFSYFIFIFPF